MQISKHIVITVSPRESEWLMGVLDLVEKMEGDELHVARVAEMRQQLTEGSELVLVNLTEIVMISELSGQMLQLADNGDELSPLALEFYSNLSNALRMEDGQ